MTQIDNRLLVAERNTAAATENAKIAVGIVATASKTLEAAMASVASANAHAEAATKSAAAPAAALAVAREEFAKLVERTK